MNAFNYFSSEWIHSMQSAGWQALLIAVLVFVLLILTRRFISAQLRYAILLLVLLKFMTPPFLILSTGFISQYSTIRFQPIRSEIISLDASAQTINASTTSQPSNQTKNSSPLVAKKLEVIKNGPGSNRSVMTEVSKPKPKFPWSTLLMSVYLFGTTAFAALLIHRYRLVRRVVRAGEIQKDGFLWSELERIAKQLKMKSIPQLRISDQTDAPFAMGVFRPVVVLPRLIETQLQPDQLTIVIAHELAHIRRRDLLIGWFETLVSLVWWFHPAMWWLRKALRQTREDCCDDILLTNQLAEPERYCETLIDAASHQSTKLAEPLVLGFVRKEHPVARRIRRLMNGSLFRADRLRFSASIVTLVLAFILLPGMRQDRQKPVTQTTLEGLFGWHNLSFQLDPSEEAVIKKCNKIARTYFSTIGNKKKKFSLIETREKLEAILSEHPDCFYAQYLLGTWYRLNGDLERSTQLLNESLVNAPVVLTQSYKLGNGKPIQGVEIPGIEIECNRVQNHSLDPSLKMKFVGLITDSNGMVHLPVYDTIYRTFSQSYPVGYYAEFKNLGWFRSNSLNGELPDVMVWRPWSKPRNFTRTAAESQWLRDAEGTDTLQLESGPNTYTIGDVSRVQSDGTFTIENGKGESLSSFPTDLPDIKNATFMDHAMIKLSSPEPSRFEVAEVHILDSQTKIPLQQFQSGAGYTWKDKSNFRLFSMWDKLPDMVDLVLNVYNYDQNVFRYNIQPKIGTTVLQDGFSCKISHLIAGHHIGWGTREGFYGEVQSPGSTSEIIIDIIGTKRKRVSLWVVSKEGRKVNLKNDVWNPAIVNGSPPIDIMMPLDEIDHFELLPSVKPVKIYFEKIQLPARKAPLDQQLPLIEFPVEGVARKFTTDTLSPLIVHFESQRGDVNDFCSCGSQDYSFYSEKPEDKRLRETKSTLTWNYFATIDLNHRQEIFDNSGIGKTRGSTICSSHWGTASITLWDAPLETMESVRLQFLPKTAD
ncbi:M56 family metallopeptidase [Gimesia aquarii]|uniref:Regulatory protein BlaR1 n=1 Tax=Gimesia aquarii TaxID=2527964 RepID=A0A517VS90_9PLAN|nr:M56 family metallopeptidase [Gimesia aquarii]QDT95886.1 Regulatory protein BlaR1 [Gimesia aquarii]